MTQALPLVGYEYQIFIAENLEKLPRLDTAKILLRHGNNPVSLIHKEQIRQIFKTNSEVRWDMFKLGTDGGKYFANICRLILEGSLKIDFNHPFVGSSLIHATTYFIGGTSW